MPVSPPFSTVEAGEDTFLGLPENKTFNLQLVDVNGFDDRIQGVLTPIGLPKGIANLGFLKTIKASDTQIRIFKHLIKGVNTFQVYAPKADFSAAYISTSIDYENDTNIQITAVDNNGLAGASEGVSSTGTVSGVVEFNGEIAQRTVVLLADDKQAGRRVLAETTSGIDGTFTLNYENWEGEVIAVALDSYGAEWAATTSVSNGAVMHPVTPNGFVYVASGAGTTGATEPAWSTDGTTNVSDGSVTWVPREYYRPTGSGPVKGNVTIQENPGPVGFRHYRIYMTENNGDASFFMLQEVQFATEPGGANIITSEMANTATASDVYNNASYPASKAFDGVEGVQGNLWLSASGTSTPSWVAIDLGTNFNVTELRIFTGDEDIAVPRAPTNFIVQGSEDGLTWTDVKTFTGVGSQYVINTWATFDLTS